MQIYTLLFRKILTFYFLDRFPGSDIATFRICVFRVLSSLMKHFPSVSYDASSPAFLLQAHFSAKDLQKLSIRLILTVKRRNLFQSLYQLTHPLSLPVAFFILVRQ